MIGIISAGLGAISSACSAIGGALGGACSTIATSLGKAMTIGANVFSSAINNIGVIGKIFNLIPQQANIEKDMTDLGMRIEKSDMKSDEFESAKEYINHLRNNIEICKEDISVLSDEKKKIHQIVGSSLIAKGVGENFTVDIPASFWVETALTALTSGQVHKLLNGYQSLGLPANLKGFSERSLTISDNKSVYSLLTSVLQELGNDIGPKTPEDLIVQRNNKQKGSV